MFWRMSDKRTPGQGCVNPISYAEIREFLKLSDIRPLRTWELDALDHMDREYRLKEGDRIRRILDNDGVDPDDLQPLDVSVFRSMNESRGN